MPKIEVNDKFFFKCLGREYTSDELEEIFPKAKAELGWEATRDLNEMCKDAWNWQSKNPKGYGGSQTE